MESGLLARSAALLCVVALPLGCGGAGKPVSRGDLPSPGGGDSFNVAVSWNANRERAVNSAGGGYRVYYGKIPGFSISGAASVEVPYVSGATAPTGTSINGLAPGTYYFKVVAYSALIPPQGGTGSASQPTSEFSLTLP
jgi:hypothetical protein